ncbi:MAG: cation:proton antiporter [Candidatus Omnitrophica bacterium]|nr:cation:proton antiporter [Candidatus Omnitrophota bacterium]
MILFVLDLVLMLMGLYVLITNRNLIKKVIGFAIMEHGLNLLLIMIGYRKGGEAPVVSPGMSVSAIPFVDPLPQAVVLTSIVIGLGITALMVGMCIRIYQRYGTFDIAEIRRLRG